LLVTKQEATEKASTLLIKFQAHAHTHRVERERDDENQKNSSGCLFFHVHESTLMKFPEKPNTKQ
jgi:hypothetical protein